MILVAEIFTLLVLALWFLATIVHATQRWPLFVHRLGIIGLLIPTWSFFAPNPGVHDYYLLYRDQWHGGGIGVWKQVPGINLTLGRFAAVWNPGKIERKALFDFVQALTSEAPEPGMNFDLIKLSVPYLMMLNYVSNVPRSNHAIATQFMVMRSYSVNDTIEPFFVSGFHMLDQ